jgi:hypothetical protein
MVGGVTLDQLRTFVAAAEQGSFSAADRKLRRGQSVVSQTLANLEGQLGVMLFDRSARYQTLTEDGRALLENARAVADQMDGSRTNIGQLSSPIDAGISPEVDEDNLSAQPGAVNGCELSQLVAPLREGKSLLMGNWIGELVICPRRSH